MNMRKVCLVLACGLVTALPPATAQQTMTPTPQSSPGARTGLPIIPRVNTLRRTWRVNVISRQGLQGVFNAYTAQLIGQGFGTPRAGEQATAATRSGTFTRRGERVRLTVRSLGHQRYVVMVQPGV